MAQEVTRTFDILDRYLNEFPRKDALGGKKDGGWYTYSTEEYVEKSHRFALGLMALGLKKETRLPLLQPTVQNGILPIWEWR